jgi:uncharacterized protein YjbI with pentapeptide repeats
MLWGFALYLQHHKPFAKVSLFLIAHRLSHGLYAIPMHAGLIEAAVPTDVQGPSALRADIPKSGLVLSGGRRSADVTHASMLAQVLRPWQGEIPLRAQVPSVYPILMFAFTRCEVSGCQLAAITGQRFCALHHPDPARGSSDISELLAEGETIKDINLSGISLEGLNLGKRHFYGCNLSHAKLRNVLFTGAVFRMCFFDFANMDSCDFSSSDIQFCSLAGCEISNSSFENSEFVHNNFNGSHTKECTFNYSNLYNSRFIRATFEATDFVDCNMKKAFFLRTTEKEVSFKFSNTQEALFDISPEDEF